MYRYWDEEEIELLEEESGKVNLKSLAKKLGRSETAVFQKQQRLGIGGFLQNTDMLTCNSVAKILGVEFRTVAHWESKGLKSYRKRPYRMYKQNELVRFLKEHQELWNANRVTDATIFLNAEWFLQKKKKDTKNTTWFWSWEDREILKHLRREGYTIREIAEKTGRSESSIKYYLYRVIRPTNKGGKKNE